MTHRPYARWTEEELGLMRELYETPVPMTELVVRFGRAADILWRKGKKLGLRRPASCRRKGLRLGGNAWTTEQDAYLRDVYGTEATMAEIVERLGRSLYSVYKRAIFLAIKRPIGAKQARPKPAVPAVVKRNHIVIGKPKARAGWGPNDPPTFTPETKFTYAPPPPAMVFRTNTFQ